MSRKEARRPGLVQAVLAGTITTAAGAHALEMSLRQFRRLKARYRTEGVRGLVHRRRGQPSGRGLDVEVRDRVVELVQTTYRDFNDCHCSEKLRELEGLPVSRSTVRRLRRAPGLPPKRRRRPPQHRARRATLRVLHGGPRFLRDFDMLGLAEGYRVVTERRGFPVPSGYRARRPTVQRIGGVLAVRPPPTVPCHNDLLADNFIEQDDRLRLVDWEYSGNGDPAFDVGNTCRELDYDDDQVQEICQAYFGGAPAPLMARVRLHMIVSDVGWALWAAIQTAISRIAFDFEAYGAARWARAEAAMDSPDFPRWLEAVTHPDAAGST